MYQNEAFCTKIYSPRGFKTQTKPPKLVQKASNLVHVLMHTLVQVLVHEMIYALCGGRRDAQGQPTSPSMYMHVCYRDPRAMSTDFVNLALSRLFSI